MHINNQEPTFYVNVGLNPDGAPADTSPSQPAGPLEGSRSNRGASSGAVGPTAAGTGYPQPCFPAPQPAGDSRGLMLFPKFSLSKELTVTNPMSRNSDGSNPRTLTSGEGRSGTTTHEGVATGFTDEELSGQRSVLAMVHTVGARGSAFAESPVATDGPAGCYSNITGTGSTGKLGTDGSKSATVTSTLASPYGSVQHQVPLPVPNSEEHSAAAALLQTEAAGNTMDGDVPEDAHRFSWCVPRLLLLCYYFPKVGLPGLFPFYCCAALHCLLSAGHNPL